MQTLSLPARGIIVTILSSNPKKVKYIRYMLMGLCEIDRYI